MVCATTSVWLVIGPALIAGTIGLASALLSYVASQRALARSLQDAREGRAHQRDLLIWERRLGAVESIWQQMFDLQQLNDISADVRAELVRAVVWLPEVTGREVLALLLA